MLSSRFLRRPSAKIHGAVYNTLENGFAGMLNYYKIGLNWSLSHGGVVMLFLVGIFVLTGFLFTRIPKGFLPSEDNGQIFSMTEAAQGISFDDLVKHQRALAAIVAADPNVESFMSSCGSRGFGQVFHAQAVVVVSPLAALHHCLGDLLQGEVRECIPLGPKRRAAHQQ